MFSWAGRSKVTEPSLLGFGKVPAIAEFVRFGARHPIATSHEDWLVKATEWAAGRRASRWPAEFDSAPAQAFVLRASGDPTSLIVGVVRPSRDSVGRRFPLVFGAVVPAKPIASSPFLAPLLFGAFFGQADVGLVQAARASSLAEFQQCLGRIELPDLARVEQVASGYGDWAQHASAWELFERTFEQSPIDRAEHALHSILDATAPFHGQEAPPTSLSVRLPLGADNAPMAAFWLDCVRLAAGWKQSVPGFFASRCAPGGSILVQLGDLAPSSVLADVWLPDTTSEHVYDLTVSTQDVPTFLTPLPQELSDALADPECTVAEVVATLTT
jgi:type VI secretion system protein ImpM